MVVEIIKKILKQQKQKKPSVLAVSVNLLTCTLGQVQTHGANKLNLNF